MASGVGTATLDFGSGDTVASVAVTGQTGLTSTGSVDAWFQGDTTARNTPDDHALAASVCKPAAVAVTTGGFTIQAIATTELTGTYTVHWAWYN